MESKNSRHSTRIFLFATGIILFFESISLFPDRLRLKSGQVLNGKAVSVTERFVEWESEKRKQRFPHAQIEEILVGYEGPSICFQRKSEENKDCDWMAVSVSKAALTVTQKSNPLELTKIPVKDVYQWEVYSTDSLSMEEFFELGLEGIWKFQDESLVEGQLVQKTKLGFILQKKSHQKQEFTWKEFVSVSYQNKSLVNQLLVHETPKVIPGLKPALEKNYTKASLLFGGAFVSSLGMWYHYNQSVNAINNDLELLPTGDGRVLVFTNTFGNSRYDFHRERFVFYSVALVAILSYTLYDNFYIGETKWNEKEEVGKVYLQPILTSTSRDRFGTNLPTNIQNPLSHEHLQYGFGFSLVY